MAAPGDTLYIDTAYYSFYYGWQDTSTITRGTDGRALTTVMMSQDFAPALRAPADTGFKITSLQVSGKGTSTPSFVGCVYNMSTRDSLWSDNYTGIGAGAGWIMNDNYTDTTKQFRCPAGVYLGFAIGSEGGNVTIYGWDDAESNTMMECTSETQITDPLCTRDALTALIPSILVQVEKLVVEAAPPTGQIIRVTIQ